MMTLVNNGWNSQSEGITDKTRYYYSQLFTGQMSGGGNVSFQQMVQILTEQIINRSCSSA